MPTIPSAGHVGSASLACIDRNPQPVNPNKLSIKTPSSANPLRASRMVARSSTATGLVCMYVRFQCEKSGYCSSLTQHEPSHELVPQCCSRQNKIQNLTT